MPNFTNSALRLLRRMVGAPPRIVGPLAGKPSVMDANTAVAVVETWISETAGLGASFPAETADLVWRAQANGRGSNQLGQPLATTIAEGPRGALAAAIGMALSGCRSTTFLSACDLAGAQDLLMTAAGRRLPLIVHLHGRAPATSSPALGSGHEVIHQAAESGCFVLVAANVQEAVDFSIVARQAAEHALIPGIVAMDGEQTAMALQDVRLPPRELAETFLGRPDDQIPSPTSAQELVCGEYRRRVPRWHNPDRPVLLGSLHSSESWGPAQAAAEVFFESQLKQSLSDALQRFSELTGREHRTVSCHRIQGAKRILVAQGAAIETAEAIAEKFPGLKLGVLGIRCLRPFPGAEVARHLSGSRQVWVLERLVSPLAEDPPLLREVRSALARALDNDRFGADTHAGYPVLAANKLPHCRSAIYGLGGLPLRASDLIRLCRHGHEIRHQKLYLGMDFAQRSSAFPKRQVLLDRLRRSYPEIAELGLSDPAPSPDLRPQGAITLALHQRSGALAAGGLALDAALFLQQLSNGPVRSRPALYSEPWGEYCVDLVTTAPETVRDPGDEATVDLALISLFPEPAVYDLPGGLASGGALLLETALPDAALLACCSSGLRSALVGGTAVLYRCAPPSGAADSANDFRLGAICAALLAEERIELSRRRLVHAREELLQASVVDSGVRRDQFEAGLDSIQRIDCSDLPEILASSDPQADDEAPALVRRLGKIDDAYDSLPRFWDQVGVLYRHGQTEDLSPDPYLAMGAVPPLTSSFRSLGLLSERIPSFDPLLCTGCGDCWSACPDNAIGVTALSPKQMIETGIGRSGTDALRPLAGKLAQRLAALCGDPASIAATTGELLREAADNLHAKLPYPEDRKAAVRADLDALIAAIGCLPLAATATLFHNPEQEQKGSGDLLTLAIDPDGCKGCGICTRVCAPRALQEAPRTPQALSGLRQIRRVWEELPDTAERSLQHLRQDSNAGIAAAALMSPHAARALAGGDGSEPGCGAKLALRLALSALESEQGPRFERFLLQVRDTEQAIAGLIREILSAALPADDLDALAQGLADVDTRQTDLRAFLAEAENAVDGTLDAARLRRLVELSRKLQELSWRISEGRQGMGRARLGLVLSSNSPVGWISAFPWNPYSEPVTIDLTGDAAQLAAGLLEGQLRQSTEAFVVLRQARLELEQPADAARMWSDLESLTWRDLTADERRLCPSLLLVGDSGLLNGRGLGQLVSLLGSDLPLRILLLAELDLGLATRAEMQIRLSSAQDASLDVPLLALSQRSAFIAQTSLGYPEHLLTSWNMAAQFAGPALLHVHAPSPQRHGFAANLTPDRARGAVSARIFPLFRYDPTREGAFGSRMDLDGNPAPRAAWLTDAQQGPTTAAQWAIGETRFAQHLARLAQEDPEPTPLAEYLALGEPQRSQRTPYVEEIRERAESRRYRVDEALLRVSEQRLQAWRALQELAGLVTPFTERVRLEAEQEVAARHRSELAAQQAAHEQQMGALRADLTQQMRHAMRERLLRMAGYRVAGKQKQAAAEDHT